MNLIYKITLPTILLLLALIVFVSVFTRYTVEDAILTTEMERMVKTTKNALLPEVHSDSGETQEEDIHNEEAESGPGLILSEEDFENPLNEESQAHFFRYVQEFKDPEIEWVILWNTKGEALAASEKGFLGTQGQDNSNIQKIIDGAPSFFVRDDGEKSASESGCIDIFTKLELNGEIFGVIEIRLNTDSILAPSTKHLNNIIIVSTLAGLLILIAIYFVNRYFLNNAALLSRNKEEFFAIASHEMRTPLSVIQASTSTILKYYPEKRLTEGEMLGFIKQAHDSSVRLITLANDYIDTLRIEQKKSLFDIKDVNLEEVTDSVISEINPLAINKGLALSFDRGNLGDIGHTIVKADPERVRQVVYNMILNAIHYTKVGRVDVRLEPDGKYLKMIVSDTGIGISPVNQALLFQKFQQAGKDVLSRDVSLSVGMGLYICKLLIENMKGKIGLIRSEEGKGSVFYFSLPIA